MPRCHYGIFSGVWRRNSTYCLTAGRSPNYLGPRRAVARRAHVCIARRRRATLDATGDQARGPKRTAAMRRADANKSRKRFANRRTVVGQTCLLGIQDLKHFFSVPRESQTGSPASPQPHVATRHHIKQKACINICLNITDAGRRSGLSTRPSRRVLSVCCAWAQPVHAPREEDTTRLGFVSVVAIEVIQPRWPISSPLGNSCGGSGARHKLDKVARLQACAMV